jgi:radial spoke head protein 1
MRLVVEWKDNKLVKGRWIFPNGTYYEGEFENNKPTKASRWYFKDGNNLQGNYNQTIIPQQRAGIFHLIQDDKKLNIKLEWNSKSDLF